MNMASELLLSTRTHACHCGTLGVRGLSWPSGTLGRGNSRVKGHSLRQKERSHLAWSKNRCVPTLRVHSKFNILTVWTKCRNGQSTKPHSVSIYSVSTTGALYCCCKTRASQSFATVRGGFAVLSLCLWNTYYRSYKKESITIKILYCGTTPILPRVCSCKGPKFIKRSG